VKMSCCFALVERSILNNSVETDVARTYSSQCVISRCISSCRLCMGIKDPSYIRYSQSLQSFDGVLIRAPMALNADKQPEPFVSFSSPKE
jgi:hypothetical protein